MYCSSAIVIRDVPVRWSEGFSVLSTKLAHNQRLGYLWCEPTIVGLSVVHQWVDKYNQS
jgi:hypothetical protein